MSKRFRQRLHLADPRRCAGPIDEGFEGTHSLFATQCAAAEAFEFVEETFDEVALLVECPVDWTILAAGGIALDIGLRAKAFRDELAQMIGVISRIHDDVSRVCQPCDQAPRLGAITPLPGGDRETDRQTKRIHRRVNFGAQTTFGAANTGSLQPPF